MVLCSLPSFHFRPREGVCDTPLRFSCDAETTVFSHHSLRNCFTIKDEVANGEPSSAGRQWYFRDGEPWFEKRAKSTCNLRNEDCFLRKTAIATAMEVDHLAQTTSAFAEIRLSLRQSGVGNRRSDIVPCANRHRICRNEIVPPTLRLRQSRWDFVHLGKPFIVSASRLLPVRPVASSGGDCWFAMATIPIYKMRTCSVINDLARPSYVNLK